MNPLDTATKNDVKIALVEGEFRRMVQYDAYLGEEEKRHITSSASRILEIADRATQIKLYELPKLPPELFVLNIYSVLQGTVYTYVFTSEDDAIESARWYASYAGWTGNIGKGKPRAEESSGSHTIYKITDLKTGDWVGVSRSIIRMSPLVKESTKIEDA